MVDLNPLICAYHNCNDPVEKKMSDFFIDLLEYGVSQALQTFCTSGAIKDYLTVNSAMALTRVLNSQGVAEKKRKRRPDLVGNAKEGDILKDEVKEEGERVIVCCLPSIKVEELKDFREAVEKSKVIAAKKGKKAVKERQKAKKSNSNKFARLQRVGKGVPWQRGIQIQEPSERKALKMEV